MKQRTKKITNKEEKKIKELMKSLGIDEKVLNKELDNIQIKVLAISKILGEPIDVNVGVEKIKGSFRVKILNVATKTGLESLINPLTSLIKPLQTSVGSEEKENNKEKISKKDTYFG